MNEAPGALPVAWEPDLDHDSGAPTAAWIVPLAAVERNDRPAPSAQDLDDVAGRSGEDRRRFLIRRTFLRALVARRCGAPAEGVAIGYDGHGAPRIRTPGGMYCSVSARGDVAAFALSSVPVGIDVEPLVAAPIAWAALSIWEKAWLLGLPEAERLAAFLQLFTLKEAYLKARGTGLLDDPAEVTISLSAPTVRQGSSTVQLRASSKHHVDVAGRSVLAACVALNRDGSPTGA